MLDHSSDATVTGSCREVYEKQLIVSVIAMLRQPSKNLFRLCGIDWLGGGQSSWPREGEMFGTSGTTDVMEKSPWQKYVLWFAAGCFVTILIFYMLLIPSAKRAAAEAAEKAAKQKLSAELAKNPVQAQLETTQAALQTATQERDECKPSLIARRSSTTTASSSTPT